MKIIDDFKKFALKGNVVDMAVGVVVGGAFQHFLQHIGDALRRFKQTLALRIFADRFEQTANVESYFFFIHVIPLSWKDSR
jgi:large-conductance mechanosensitive channel